MKSLQKNTSPPSSQSTSVSARKVKMLITTFNFLPILLLTWSSLGFVHLTKNNRTMPCDIKENYPSIVFDCRDRRLTSVPLPITYVANSTELLLSGNLVQVICKTSFKDWYNLTKIDLSANHFPKAKIQDVDICKRGLDIQNETFSNLTKLEQLLIDNNYLCKIPTGMPNTLTKLSLTFNNIFSISSESLSELKHLRKLYLGHNCFYGNACGRVFDIQDGAFANLTHLTILSLSFNNLTNVPPKLPSSLRELYLSNNKIKVIGREDFRNLVNLEILYLSGNCPRCYNAPYPCEPCSGQSSIEINPYAFERLKNLKELHLGSTSLKSVPRIWFQNTTQLKVLNLELNYLVKEIASAEFLLSLPLLEKIDLSFNYDLRSYPRNINISDNFSKLVSLQELHIQGYVFKEVTTTNLAPLTNLPKLKIINLGVNFIRQIDFKVFPKFSNLTIIYLSENKISPFSENISRSKELESFQTHNIQRRSTDDYIDLLANVSDNSKEYANGIHEPFKLVKPRCSSYGKTLDLSLNSIFFIDPEQFRSFKDIACLNLSANGIGQDLNGTEFIYLSNLAYLDLSFNKIDLASFYAFHELPTLEVLDLSYNRHYFIVEGVTHHLKFIENLPNLKVLNLSWNEIFTLTEVPIKSHSLRELMFSGNRLDVLWKQGDKRYLDIFQTFYNLTFLDISHNRLYRIPDKALSNLPITLTELYLNNNKLVFWGWKKLEKFRNLKLLDLSYNKLVMIESNLSSYTCSLQTLLLNHNMISSLPDRFLYKAGSLAYLDLSNNHLQTINKSTFLSGNENFLNFLLLKGNPFDCTCEITDFVSWINKNNITMPRLATDVTCATPGNKKGHGIIYFDVHACDLNSSSMILFFLSFFLVIHITALPIMKHLFYWDLWYIYQICVAKLKWNKVHTSNCLYDAFIVYDNKDPAVSDWVINELCYHLEDRAEKHVVLCLEERDWEPGKAVIDNLVQSINQSKKTLFVLTKKYVKSGKFKTAFYLALQRLMDENMDVIVIVLLQPVLQHSQYLRLRRKICKSSILEWPKNPHAEGLFWQRIRNVVLTENCSRYSNLYTAPLIPLQ
ncbi:toll-like receptor 8 isoform X1 [Ascaphus truei]|uniref:toll-like receptor 8 isoform X1 n=2 Tax=Ascaphus truei TaxID=8439 RepID=UPI003F5AA116